MKKYFKKLSLAFAILVSLFGLNACSKEESGQYIYKLFELEEMYYIVAEEDTAVSFFEELGNIMTEYDGTDFRESSLKSSINKVVKKYDNGVLEGTFYLKKCLSEGYGSWTTVTSWTMKFNSKYNTKSSGTGSFGTVPEALSGQR